MKIFENKNWPDCYLLKDGSESLLLKYRHNSSNNNECLETGIDMDEWIEIIEPKK
ncbi:hypothetical protein [Domibacillus tundrae]|uniref:hypothetical protein n=1 Tax=Domibacillus tundrae TaxID=1587527 RepID=UPI000AA8E3D3|nr:hypothetical protein [Domibacillus tundrae]